MMIGLSILAIVNLGQMAAAGNAQMAADAAKNAAGEAGQSAVEETAKGAKEAAKNVVNNGGNSSLNFDKFSELAKQNKLPGINLNDPNLIDGSNIDVDQVCERLIPKWDNLDSIGRDEMRDKVELLLKKAGKYWVENKG